MIKASEHWAVFRRFGRQGEWGEKPRESVTVMPCLTDESDYLKAAAFLPEPEIAA